MSQESKVNMRKWDSFYRAESEGVDEDICIDILADYIDKFSGDINGFALDAGCGSGRSTLALSKKARKVIGVDFSLAGLQKAKKLFREKGINGYFILADVRHLPFKDEQFNFVFADGSLEHFRDTENAFREIRRCLKKDKVVFATVPVISISTLTYLQLHGNIPDVPVVRQIWELFHWRLLKGKYMKMGYEKSFTMRKIYGVLKSEGYVNIEVGHFDTFNEIKLIKNESLKRFFRWLARHRLFWPLIYVCARKGL